MKDKTLATIVISGYVALALVYGGLLANRLIRNYIEDRTAVAKADSAKGDRGTLIDHSYGYVAFDKSGDGKIDEIKEYRRSMVGVRILSPVPYSLRYHEGDKKFEQVKQIYFSQNK